MFIFIPQLLQPRYGTIHRQIFPVQNLEASVARLLRCDPVDSFKPHWRGEFDHQYSIIAVKDEHVMAYAQYDFRGFSPEQGAYGATISCLVSHGKLGGQQEWFFDCVLNKYRQLIERRAAMHPELIDHPLGMPWISLRHGQRDWARLIKRRGWKPFDPSGDFKETPAGKKRTVSYEPPTQYIAC